MFLSCPILRKNPNINDIVSQFNDGLRRVLTAFSNSTGILCDYIDINTDRGFKGSNWLIGRAISESILSNIEQVELCNGNLEEIDPEPTYPQQINRSPQASASTLHIDTPTHSVSLFEELNASCNARDIGNFDPNVSQSSAFLGTRLLGIKYPPIKTSQ